MVVVEYVMDSQTPERERSARDELRASVFTDGNAVLLAHPMVDPAARKVLFLDSLMCRRRKAGGALRVRKVTRLWQELRSQQEKEEALLVIAETGADF